MLCCRKSRSYQKLGKKPRTDPALVPSSEGTWSCQRLELGLVASRAVRLPISMRRPLSLWHLVMAAPANTHSLIASLQHWALLSWSLLSSHFTPHRWGSSSTPRLQSPSPSYLILGLPFPRTSSLTRSGVLSGAGQPHSLLPVLHPHATLQLC